MQCPDAGGPAVFTARSLIGLLNDTIIYDDDNICLQAGYYRQQRNVENSKLPDVEVIPNPASETVNFVLKNSTEGVCRILLMNSIGKTIFEGSFNCSLKSYSLDISHFAAGIYHAEIEISNSVYKNAKLVIVR
jgi:hypothetical protein